MIDQADGPPPFKIPQLRFVDAGLALAHSAPRPTVKGKVPSGTLCGAYLLEEKIVGLYKCGRLDNHVARTFASSSCPPQ